MNDPDELTTQLRGAGLDRLLPLVDSLSVNEWATAWQQDRSGFMARLRRLGIEKLGDRLQFVSILARCARSAEPNMPNVISVDAALEAGAPEDNAATIVFSSEDEVENEVENGACVDSSVANTAATDGQGDGDGDKCEALMEALGLGEFWPAVEVELYSLSGETSVERLRHWLQQKQDYSVTRLCELGLSRPQIETLQRGLSSDGAGSYGPVAADGASAEAMGDGPTTEASDESGDDAVSDEPVEGLDASPSSLLGFLQRSGFAQLHGKLRAHSLRSWLEILHDDRPAFLRRLKRHGVERLSDRQGLANAMSKGVREQVAVATY